MTNIIFLQLTKSINAPLYTLNHSYYYKGFTQFLVGFQLIVTFQNTNFSV